ncbi:MAG: divergent PAP2 family protein [Mangrovibacterium sp.]
MNTLKEIFSNQAIMAAFTAWAIAQLTKVLIDIIKNKKFNYALLTSSGGWPSSHSSSVVALSTSIGLTDGFTSSTYAISLLFAIVVMYDATGVRRAAGEQAGVLNNFSDFMQNLGFKTNKKLKELLGHSPVEVMSGAALGLLVALLFARI